MARAPVADRARSRAGKHKSPLTPLAFTCQSSGIIRGEVTGRNGDRIRNWRIDEIKPQSQGGSEFNIGGCVRTR